MTQNTFDLKDYSEKDSESTITMRATLEDTRVCIEEMPADGRGVIVELRGDVIKLRVFSADKQNPVCIVLPSHGGVGIDRIDFDAEVPPPALCVIGKAIGERREGLSFTIAGRKPDVWYNSNILGALEIYGTYDISFADGLSWHDMALLAGWVVVGCDPYPERNSEGTPLTGPMYHAPDLERTWPITDPKGAVFDLL